MKLNLGACDRRIEGFISVDRVPPADIIADLEHLWPWPDATVDEVLAFDVAEHIGDCPHISWRGVTCEICDKGFGGHRLRHWSGRIHFMNELHRILKPGGVATIEVPDALQGAGFYQDPTHKSPWTRNSFQYFGAGPGGDFARNRLGDSYGIKARFHLRSIDRREYSDTFDKVWKIIAVLEAVK